LIESQISRIIIPFAYNQDFEHTIRTIDRKCWRDHHYSRERLLKHIDLLIASSDDAQENIGRMFVLEPFGRVQYGLRQREDDWLDYKPTKKEHFHFCILTTELYVFKTNIGLIVLDIGYPEEYSHTDVVLCNYYLKKPYAFRRQLHWKDNGHPFVIPDFINMALAELKIDTFFDDVVSSETSTIQPNHAVIYNTLLLKQEPEIVEQMDVGRLLFNMRRSFKQSYLPSPQELAIDDNNNELYQPFANSFWGVSLEACAHVSLLTDDSVTNNFFRANHQSNLRRTYFYLFVLILHQHYALQYMSLLAARLPAFRDKHILGSNVEIERLREKMVQFKLQSSFKVVTNITHQSKLYDLYRKVYRIDDLMDELHLEIDALTSLMEIKRNAKNNLVQMYVVILSLVFVIISAVSDGLSIIRWLEESITLVKPISKYALGGIYFLVALGIGMLLFILYSFFISSYKLTNIRDRTKGKKYVVHKGTK
jgi:hypothetical protein